MWILFTFLLFCGRIFFLSSPSNNNLISVTFNFWHYNHGRVKSVYFYRSFNTIAFLRDFYLRLSSSRCWYQIQRCLFSRKKNNTFTVIHDRATKARVLMLKSNKQCEPYEQQHFGTGCLKWLELDQLYLINLSAPLIKSLCC